MERGQDLGKGSERMTSSFRAPQVDLQPPLNIGVATSVQQIGSVTPSLSPEKQELHNAFLNFEAYWIKAPRNDLREREGLPLITDDDLREKRELDLKAAVKRQRAEWNEKYP